MSDVSSYTGHEVLCSSPQETILSTLRPMCLARVQPCDLRGESLYSNYRSDIVAKGFLWMDFVIHCLAAFCAASLVKCMSQDKHLNFKNQHCAWLTSASPQPCIINKNP